MAAIWEAHRDIPFSNAAPQLRLEIIALYTLTTDKVYMLEPVRDNSLVNEAIIAPITRIMIMAPSACCRRLQRAASKSRRTPSRDRIRTLCIAWRILDCWFRTRRSASAYPIVELQLAQIVTQQA